jgi:hypothetical protein
MVRRTNAKLWQKTKMMCYQIVMRNLTGETKDVQREISQYSRITDQDSKV